MTTRATFALLVLAFGAVPVSAQVSTRERVRDRVILGDGRADTRAGGGIGDIIFGRTSTETRTSTKVPRGHLPPRGMCRVWIDGVPPGQQPPVTSCAQAERDRLSYPNSRVIYGDVESFPGKGKGKFKNKSRDGELARQCSVWDVVVVDGRQRDVCRDGSVIRDRDGNVIRRDDDDRRGRVLGRTADRRSGRIIGEDDDDDDSDRKVKRSKNKGGKGKGRKG